MGTAAEDTSSEDHPASTGVLRRPVRVPVPDIVRRAVEPAQRHVAGTVLNASARVLVVVLPAALAVVGISLSLAAAALSEHGGPEAIGTLGLEAGSAMWFAGALALGARPGPTVLRVLLLAVTGVSGLALIGVAIVAGWSGSALDLAMEFGVGAVALVVLDVVFLGVLQARLDGLAGSNPRAPAAAPG